MSTSEPRQGRRRGAAAGTAETDGPAGFVEPAGAPGAGPVLPRLLDVSALQQAVAAFAAEREWEPFHSPKNLVMALSGEVGELAELFQWLSEEQSFQVAQRPETARAVRDELADVLMYLVRLADRLGVDLDEAARAKLVANARNYPADLARGHARKMKARGTAPS